MPTLEERVTSLEQTRDAQTPIIQKHQLALEQIKTLYNGMIDVTKDLWDQVDGLNDDDAALNALYNPKKFTYTI